MGRGAGFQSEFARCIQSFARLIIACATILPGFPSASRAQDAPKASNAVTAAKPASPESKKPAAEGVSVKPSLFVVGYAHLDTEWRWEYPQVINEFLAKTLHDNFALFEKYPLYFQFQWREPLPVHERILSGGFRQAQDVHCRGALVSRGIFGGGKRRQFTLGRVDFSSSALRERILPARIRQGQRRIHAARLLWFSGFTPEHPCAFRRKGILHAKTHMGFLRSGGAWSFTRKHSDWNSVQCRHVGRARWPRRDRGA